MKIPKQLRSRIRLGSPRSAVLFVWLITRLSWGQIANSPANGQPELEVTAREQIRLLEQEKAARTPVQRKIGSQLLYHLAQKRQGTVGAGLKVFKPSLKAESDGRYLVDLKARVSPALLRFIIDNGGLVISSIQRESAIRALIPLETAELLAQRPEVRAIRPAARAATNAAITPEAGDIAHQAAEARQFFASDGTGIKIGVLSDSIDGLTNAQASGALGSVTVLPGQEGTGAGEGTAMLEIVHALAPGSPLYFATALTSDASFAQNIRNLQAAGCKIIIDDVTYFNEGPFQDGPIARAVDDVSAAGTLYFSSAGNSGGIDRGTSGTWEGDFKDGGPTTLGKGGRLHDFGGATYNTMLPGIGFERVDLAWSDPLGASTNDYDVYILDSKGNVVTSSTDNQDGQSDPYESIPFVALGQRIVIVKYSGAGRFIHLSTGRGHLTYTTQGATYGHNASGADNAFCLAAARVPSPAAAFVGGAANPLETFSSDGPRRIFYNPDGTAITPGDFSSTGGRVLRKPDLTAADGVYTSVPGFAPFSGTSAAAPHAGAIAALLWSYNPFLTPAQVRSLLTGTALSIGGAGYDRNSGFGIVMAYQSLAAAPSSLLKSVLLSDANQNSQLDPNECADLTVTLQNISTQAITGISAQLLSSTAHVFVDPSPRVFPDMQPGQSVTSSVPFHLSTGPDFVCGSNAVFRLNVTSATLGVLPQTFELSSRLAGNGVTNVWAATNVPVAIPDVGAIESGIAVTGIKLPLSRVRVGVYVTHTYDQDLELTLISPDNTEVVLSANNGQSGQNYGADCSTPTYFSDEASVAIGAATAPFVGEFQPEQPLSAFGGKSGSAVNGVWRLRVADQAAQDVGTLQCWTLELTPIGCFDGGGQCLSPPQLTRDISDLTITNGQTAELGVGASGTGPLFYQWYFNQTTSLAGQTNASLMLSNISPAQAGPYMVQVSNVYGTATSSAAHVTVVVPATIVSGPANQITTNGYNISFSVQAEGTPPLSYQWYFNLTNVLAAQTNSTLILSNVNPAQAGLYDVVVANAFGTVTSTPANLQVVVIPVISCSPDRATALGYPWDFTPPSYADTNLTLQLLGTTTNLLCGESFSATRQWLVSDTNGYQLTCHQTVQVLNTNPPLLSCSADKTVVYGNPWTFDVPLAQDALATEALVYDNGSNDLGAALDPGSLEIGNQITLAGSQRYLSSFSLDYWGTNSTQANFNGNVTAQIRFHHNDGPALGGSQPTPGTVFYDSGPLPITATNRGTLMLNEFALSAAVPLTGALPTNFTWTVHFDGLGSNDAAGLSVFGPPVSGQVQAGYWALQTNGWALEGQQAFGAQVGALSGGAKVTVLATVTNLDCARSFRATRTWLALDSCGNSNSCSQTVHVADHSAPLLLGQSQDQAALVGNTVTLSVQVSSCPPIAFQWFFNLTNAITDATNASLTLSNLSLAAGGSYQVEMTNNFGSATSAPIVLVVAPPPGIDSNPTDVIATNGDKVNLTVVAHGTGTLAYQWFFNNTTSLLGATQASLTLPSVNTTEAGNYDVVISDLVGSVTSTPAHLQVLVTPVTVAGTGAVAIAGGLKVDSQANVSGQTAPLARVEVGVYLTHTNDANLRLSLLSPDGTTAVLSANNGQNGTNYGSDCSTMTWFSDLATTSITNGAAPFVGEFAPQNPLSVFIGKNGTGLNGSWILRVEDTNAFDTGLLQCWSLRLVPQGCPADGSGCLLPPQIVSDISNETVTNGNNATFTISATGTQPLSYQWYFNATNALAVGTNGSLTLSNVGPANVGGYDVLVSNLYGSVTSKVASLSLAVPPEIVTSPGDQVATNGNIVTLQISAQGSAPLSYQWYFNLTNVLAAQTNSTLILSNVNPAQAGLYDVVVANAFGTVTSTPANLQVVVIPVISCSPDRATALGYPWDFTPPSYADTNLTLQLLGTTTNLLCGESFSATRQWLVSDTNGYQLTCHQTVQVLSTNPPLLSCSTDKTVVYGNPWTFDVPLAQDALATEALVYDSGSNDLGAALDPGSLEIGNQITLAGSQRYLSSFSLDYWGTNSTQANFNGNVTAQIRFHHNDGPALGGGQPTPGTVFYDSGPLPITATNRGTLMLNEFALSAVVPLTGALPTNFTWTVHFDGLGSNDAAGLSVFGPPVSGQVQAGYWALQTNGWALEGQQAFGAQVGALSSGAKVTVLATVTNLDCARSFRATRTWLALDSCGNSNSCSQTVHVVDHSAPLLLGQSQDQAALVGNTVTLSVQVSSCPPIAFQWFFNLTNAITDATNETLVLENINTSEAGLYELTISNAFGSVTSSPVNVTVDVPAVVVGSPQNLVATNGDDVHWRVLAKGSAPLFYQWYFDGTNALAQQTNATLDLIRVTPQQAGVYQVVVTNLYGSATSAPAVLTIVLPPIIISGPSDTVLTNGNTLRWAVVAGGTAPLSYQWFFNNTLLGLETNASLIISNVVAAQAGVYGVAVANDYGSVTSAPAVLQIITVPQILCSQDVTVPLGGAWDFTPPGYADTNLVLQVLDTVTNALCGGSYSATRRWLISDTNNYQLTCKQTVTILDPAVPVISCPGNKTVLAGTPWNFDIPTAREWGAKEAVVYDNLTNGTTQLLDSAGLELGNQIQLDGTNRYPGRFTVEYWGTNSSSSTFAGTVNARVRFYRNDGPVAAVSVAQPGSLFYDSGPLAIAATNSGALELEQFQIGATIPFIGQLPSNFTWTVQFQGLGSNDSAGLNVYGPPVTGQSGQGYWLFNTNTWTIQGHPGQSFGAQFSALSSGAALSAANTITNIQCPQTYTVSRTWQATDVCSNAAVCTQTVTVVNPSVPAILNQSTNEAVGLNQTVQLNVLISSCPPLSFQWYFDGTNAVASGTNASLLLTNVTIDEAGDYQVVISNSYGSVTSAPVVLTISGMPVILSQPLDALVAEGGVAQFGVTAEGSPAPSYHWYFDATNALVGETGPSLVLSNVQPGEAGFYSVVISNNAGSITSTPARLTIIGAPLITAQPQGVTNFQGQSVTFSVAATGSVPLSYQWMANCSRPISGATTPTLRLKSVGPLDSGNYCVVVSNAMGFVISQPAVLRVLVQPKLVSLVNLQGDASLSFSTVTNLLYSVYFSDTLPGTNWALLPNMFQKPGTGSPMVVQDPTAPASQRFYRILVQ